MRSRAKTFLLAVVLATTSACAGLIGIEERFFEPVVGDEGGVPDATTDTTSDSFEPPVDAGPDAACPMGMVLAGTFCIDATEVTQKAYAIFLSATNGDAGGQIAQCAPNTTFAPAAGCALGFDLNSNKPMACIDWCDAHAYCAWAGKRLCGDVKGGPLQTDASPDLAITTSDQWFAACSRNADGLHTYPYGNDYDGGVCNAVDRWDGATPMTVDVGSIGCVGGYEGLHDMSGNVWEWEDACRPAANDAGIECLKRGGAYTDPGWAAVFNLVCRARYFNNLMSTSPDIGFRCCELAK